MGVFGACLGSPAIPRNHIHLGLQLPFILWVFVHNPNVCLNIYIKEKMDDTIGILHDIKRLQNDGFLIFILQYNFKALVDETMAVTQAVPTHVVDQFLKRFPIYEKGKGDLSQLE